MKGLFFCLRVGFGWRAPVDIGPLETEVECCYSALAMGCLTGLIHCSMTFDCFCFFKRNVTDVVMQGESGSVRDILTERL